MSIGNSTRPSSLNARTASARQAGAVTTTFGSGCGDIRTVVAHVSLTPAEKTAAITKVRCLEHDLFDGGRVCRELTRQRAEAMIAELNQLREALGWLEIDVEGRWRWPHTPAH
jgi:hypothetical protein